MDYKGFIQKIGFLPKENAKGIFYKKYPNCKDYAIEVDLENSKFNFGKLLSAESKTTQNFSQAENWVVFECVNRLLEKGYQPQNIKLEKTWATGHGTSGRLDILVTRDDGTAYMMIECKTFGIEFDKEYKKILKDGGQLFTYFQQDKNADILMLYTSEIDKKGNLEYKNEIVKIEDDYRQTGNVKDFYDRWNKLPKSNGFFDDWVQPYDFKSKAITPKTFKEIKQADSSFIFNRFLEILRHNVVSDKPNAFNKIFTLFLCKIYDEKSTKNTQELAFQWLEGIDDHISFQKRLTDLYRKGMKEFLDKEVSDMSDEEFESKFGLEILSEAAKKQILEQFTNFRLKKNNEFAIKEVFDDASFEDNAKVVKEVVELLQGYKIRYTKRHQYLSDFFELLLTTGLKQESGQFFTPVPVAQFIIKSIPLDTIVLEKLNAGEADNLLPVIIDYAAGSGHFLTESMHEVQRILDKENPDKYIDATKKKIQDWQNDHFNWAIHYVYGIEKDYRLVKVGKVGCYLHGDGLAKVIHGDGLANFTETKEYQGKLKARDKYFPQENKQFDIVISNPPYSVSAFKGTLKNVETEFDLFDDLTDQSSQIECLFIERTKQLLKDGGIAGIILPSSILSNTGIYTKAREIILQYFDIVAIAELGSNTFMATGTNTVTLFLRRRKNEVSKNIRLLSDRFAANLQDVTINGIESPVSKYVSHVWDGVTYSDYVTLIQRRPNEAIQNHEIYKEYQKKITAKMGSDKWDIITEKEQEKLFYFIVAYPQKVILVKSGEKNEERQFLGYEFSNRRGSEGIHPIQRGKTIDECTRLFDTEVFDNPEKASTYIYKAFHGDFDFEIYNGLEKNISRHNLVDMLTFDRIDFEKNMSLAVKKKKSLESKWPLEIMEDISIPIIGNTSKIAQFDIEKIGKYPVVSQEENTLINGFSNNENPILDVPVILFGDHSCTLKYIDFPFFRGADGTVLIKPKKEFNTKYLFYILNLLVKPTIENSEKYERHYKYLKGKSVPRPPKDIQEKIVTEIEIWEVKEENARKEVEKHRKKIKSIIDEVKGENKKMRDLCRYSDQKTNSVLLTSKNYIGVDNLLQNTMGKTDSNFIPGSGTSTAYNVGDILLSNIRPYLKKIWYADNNGGSSNDVLVLQTTAKNITSKYLFYNLKQDKFFDYEMQEKKGVKMPRGDKQHILDYIIPVPTLIEQQKIVLAIEKIEQEILALENEIATIPKQKEAILKKYL